LSNIKNRVLVNLPSIKEESQEDVFKNLESISKLLIALLPDTTLSPLERIERLARVIPDSIQSAEQHLTARTKLKNIRIRLAELVNDSDMSEIDKINYLVAKTNELVPGESGKLFNKLEKIGDNRMRSNGGVPFSGWNKNYLDFNHLIQTLGIGRPSRAFPPTPPAIRVRSKAVQFG
jgi:hypothetical protein